MSTARAKLRSLRNIHDGLKRPTLVITAEELFDLWRSLDVRIYLDEYVDSTSKKSLARLKELRSTIAKSLNMPRKIQHDFFETYYRNTIDAYDHEVFHELINNLGYQEEELDSMLAHELIDKICEQYNAPD